MLAESNLGPVLDVVDDDAVCVDAVAEAASRCGGRSRHFPSAASYAVSPSNPEAACLVVGVRASGGTELGRRVELVRVAVRSKPVIVIGPAADLRVLDDLAKAGQIGKIATPIDLDRVEAVVRHAMLVEAPRRAAEGRFADLSLLIRRLTQRELAILRGVAAGRLNKGVATDLQMSVRTVENDRAKILSKLDVESSAEAIAHYVEYRTLARLGYRVDGAEPIADGPHDGRSADTPSRRSDSGPGRPK